MKSNCIGVADLLCAYADGELTGQNVQLVEDHLTICENCSAILKIYSEISDSIDETNVPAPEALRIGVMNRIQGESIQTEEEKVKKRSNYHFILTRYAPVAACLVVGLLIWQFWGSLWGTDNAAMPEAAPAPEAVSAAPADIAPEAAMQMDDAMDATDDDTSRAGIGAFGLDGDAEDTDVSALERPAEEIERISEYINDAYAEIAVTGELPALLEGHDPEPFGSWFGWEMVFEIPSSKVPELLEELADREDLVVTRLKESSNYAVVLFSPGE